MMQHLHHIEWAVTIVTFGVPLELYDAHNHPEAIHVCIKSVYMTITVGDKRSNPVCYCTVVFVINPHQRSMGGGL